MERLEDCTPCLRFFHGGMAAPKHRRTTTLVGPIFFGAVFAFGGGMLLHELLGDPRLRSKPQSMAIGVGMASLFLLIGLGSIVRAVWSWNKARDRMTSGEFRSDQPWTEREDWTRGEIESSARTSIAFWWAFAGFWNAIAWPLMWVVLPEYQKGNQVTLVAGLFPLVGIGLLVAAVRATMRRLKYGRCRLLLTQTPIPIGGVLDGRIVIPSGLTPDNDPVVSLSCVKRVTTGTGKNRHTQTYGLWHRDVEIDRTKLGRGPYGTEIAVRIPIDADCRSTDSDARISWELSVSAKTPGIDFETMFVVPVFDDPAGAARSQTISRAHTAPTMERVRAPEERLQAARIRWSETGPSGHPELILPPPVPVFGTFVGLAMGGGMLYGAHLMHAHHISMVGTVALGFMGGVILLGMLGTLRGATRVRLEPSALVVSSRGLFGLKTKRVDPSLVRAVKAGMGGAQQGKSGTYQIMLDCDAPEAGAGIANALYGSLLAAAAERSGTPLDRRPGLPVPLGGVFDSQSAATEVASFLEARLRDRYRLAGTEA